jgi:hypothetical protein
MFLKEHPPTKIKLDDNGRKLIISKLNNIIEFTDIIHKHGVNYTDCNSYYVLLSLKNDFLSIPKYLYSINEDPKYLNDLTHDLMSTFDFITIGNIGIKEKIKYMSTEEGILDKRWNMITFTLPEQIGNFVSEISNRYGLSDDMNSYIMKKIKNKHTDSKKLPEPENTEEPDNTQKQYNQQNQYHSIYPLHSDKYDIKKFQNDLVEVWVDQNFVKGNDIKRIFDKHYQKALLSGLDKDTKDYLKSLKENDIDLLEINGAVFKHDLTYQKLWRLVNKLKLYSD